MNICILNCSFPDDKFNRLWQPFKDENPVVNGETNVTSSDFWNIPPAKAFASGITGSEGKILQIKWPPLSLPGSRYYIALYFQDHRAPSPSSWRIFSVAINDIDFYKDVNATTKGVVVSGSEWPLSGETKITLTPQDGSAVGPIINAGEIFQLLPLGGRTHTKDGSHFFSLLLSICKSITAFSDMKCLASYLFCIIM